MKVGIICVNVSDFKTYLKSSPGLALCAVPITCSSDAMQYNLVGYIELYNAYKIPNYEYLMQTVKRSVF